MDIQIGSASPPGWVFYLNKFLVRSSNSTDFEKEEKQFGEMAKLEFDEGRGALTSYGNFDRITMAPVDSFADYQERTTSSYIWLGRRQSILLYTLPGETHIFRDCGETEAEETADGADGAKAAHRIDKHERIEYLNDTGGTIQPRFVSLSLLRISGAAKASIQEYARFLELIRKQIHTLVEAYKKHKTQRDEILFCEVFGTFNSSEVAIVWTADQYVDVLFLIDQIRHLHFHFGKDHADEEVKDRKRICTASYTVVAQTQRRWPPERATGVQPVKGRAVIQLESASEQFQNMLEYLQKIVETIDPDGKECSLQSCAGEYDFMLSVPGRVLEELFTPRSAPGADPQKFSIHNRKFVRNFRQTTTRLSYGVGDIDPACFPDLPPESEGGGTESCAIPWQELFRIDLAEKDYDFAYKTDRLNVMKQIVEETPEGGDGKPKNIKEVKELDKEEILAAFAQIQTGRAKTPEIVRKLYQLLSSVMPHTGLDRMLLLMYSDYLDILSNELDHLWVKDYDQQFRAAVIIIASTLERYYIDRDHDFKIVDHEVVDYIVKICNQLQQQVNHISESGKLSFEAPNSNMGYTAQFDLILHAYYGFTKALLEDAYAAPRSSWQYTIVPVINFTNTPIIRSTMAYARDGNPKPARLVELQLPYAAWSSPTRYWPYLIHEVFHYVAPKDREKRNIAMIVIGMSEFCREVLIHTIHAFGLSEQVGRRLWTELRPKVRDVMKKRGADCYTNMLAALKREYHLSDAAASPDLPAYLMGSAMSCWLRDPQEWAMDLMLPMMREAVRKLPGAPDSDLLGYRRELQTLERTLSRKKLMDRLYRNMKKTREEASKAYRTLLERVVKTAVVQLREVLPDAAMVEKTGMGLTHYLVWFAMVLDNEMQLPKEIKKYENMALRAAPIINLLCDKELGGDRMPSGGEYREMLQAQREPFTALYIRLSESGAVSQNQLKRNAAKWFEAFEWIYQVYLRRYRDYEPELRIIARDYPFHTGKEPAMLKRIKDDFEAYWAQLDAGGRGDDFQLDLRLVQAVQNQKALMELRERGSAPDSAPDGADGADATVRTSSQESIPPSTEYVADDGVQSVFFQLSEITGRMCDLHKLVFGKECEKDGLWYRGVSHAEYHVVPSLFVNFFSDKYKTYDREKKALCRQPAELLQHLYEQFKFRADGSPEMLNYARYQTSDYFALMQHYQQPTNLLDWSEDVFASLYFALEDYIKGKPKKDDAEDDAALYLFDPELYNRVRKEMLQAAWKRYGAANKSRTSRRYWYKAVRPTVDPRLEPVPNVSVDENARRLSVFFQPVEYRPIQSVKLGNDCLTATLNDMPEALQFLPMALYTARLNPRIKSQSGQFVAFNPHTPPVLGEMKPEDYAHHFDYMALDRLQTYYLNSFHQDFGCSRPGLPTPFLYKLVIHHSIKEDVARELRRMGIKTTNYYPELTNEQF